MEELLIRRLFRKRVILNELVVAVYLHKEAEEEEEDGSILIYEYNYYYLD